MPYIDAVGDLYRVTLAAIYPDNQVEENQLHFVVTAPSGTDNRINFLTAINAAFVGNYVPKMGSNSTFYGSKCTILRAATINAPVVQLAAAGGGGAPAVAPTQARPIVRFVTDLAGRSHRGRTYLFTPDPNGIGPTGIMSASMNAAVDAWRGFLVNPINAGTGTIRLTIAHRNGGGPGVWTDTLVTDSIRPNLIATQRRSGSTGRVNPNAPF